MEILIKEVKDKYQESVYIFYEIGYFSKPLFILDRIMAGRLNNQLNELINTDSVTFNEDSVLFNEDNATFNDTGE